MGNGVATHVVSRTIEHTYKAREAEGWFDIQFNRKLGFQLARFFRAIGWTPIMVTLLGGVFGVAAGHLYYYRNLKFNLIGIALHVVANVLDNADGQLARLTNSSSRTGRLIDSVVDQVIFINIYFQLAFRCLFDHSFVAVVLIGLAAGFSHAVQAAAADYYRNAYLYFTSGRKRGELDSSQSLRHDYEDLRWRTQFWSKLLLRLYLNLTLQQEIFASSLKHLRDKVDTLFAVEIPEWFKTSYQTAARSAFKWWGWLMTNPRLFLLFLILLAGRPMLFFWAGLTVFNALLIYLLWRQQRMSESLLELIRYRA
jgi:hypothetical protein